MMERADLQRFFLATTALAGMALACPALAQDIEEPFDTEAADAAASEQVADTRTGVRTFTPEDFTRFAPRNALDMLNQVPGFRLSGDF